MVYFMTDKASGNILVSNSPWVLVPGPRRPWLPGLFTFQGGEINAVAEWPVFVKAVTSYGKFCKTTNKKQKQKKERKERKRNKISHIWWEVIGQQFTVLGQAQGGLKCISWWLSSSYLCMAKGTMQQSRAANRSGNTAEGLPLGSRHVCSAGLPRLNFQEQTDRLRD